MKFSGVLALNSLLAVAPLWGQISPGALSTAHSHLAGPANCTACHDLAKSPPAYNCLNCHQEIFRRLEEKRGLHPSLVGADRSGRTCVTCHSEHNGKDFALIRWDTPIARFDHRRAGYALEGKHASQGCKVCHQPARMTQDRAIGIQVKDLSRSWLGLPPKCAACHQDEHRGQLSADCERCHNSTLWKDAAQFNHERARFLITGSHTTLACEKCHQKVDDPKPYTRFRDIPFNDCTPCHNDPHKGAFRQLCQNCHTTANWKPQQITSAFNHALTKFPLEGKHGTLACRPCHSSANFKNPVAHAKCLDCHRKDPHKGQFAQRADAGDCAGCHTVDGFKPATFTMEHHASTKFPLLDKHSVVQCAKCHVTKGEETVYRFENTACLACHNDVHKGQFQGAPNNNNCEGCHTTRGFSPSTFTLVRHGKIRFPLSGAHGAVLCTECHKTRTDIYPPPPVRFHFEALACNDCHRDPHSGELAQRMAALRPDGSPLGCEACHVTRGWKEITGFDHATTSFQLDGSHRAVACESCHRTPNLRPGLKNVSFKSAPRVCSGCHDDVHGGQFAAAGAAPDCAQCHRPLKWKPSMFNHDTATTFHLTGSHKNVPCAMCHQATREISGRRVVMYKPTARDCRACHSHLTAGK